MASALFSYTASNCHPYTRVQASGALAPWMQTMSSALLMRDSSDTNAYAMADLGSDERQVLHVLSSARLLWLRVAPSHDASRHLEAHLRWRVCLQRARIEALT